jgi:hypothetical protein
MKIKNKYSIQCPSFEDNFWKVIEQNSSFNLKILKSKQSYQEAFHLCSQYFDVEKIIKSCNVSSLFYHCMLSVFECDDIISDSVRTYIIMLVLPQLHSIFYHQSKEALEKAKLNNMHLSQLILDKLNENYLCNQK